MALLKEEKLETGKSKIKNTKPTKQNSTFLGKMMNTLYY